ncbi:2-oxo acid dehydrogenase subunit E2 [Sphingobium sp. LB126]|uniref:2-oxo acid dehydrogenase subunit E2 n=1 Tax=Sphingobium sp. LB126 TaxID=1983755 RepID=UPI0012FD8EE2|nr:2-oxo acid dehydrogenase subunit E2 [Sphingobium sp. LB126]
MPRTRAAIRTASRQEARIPLSSLRKTKADRLKLAQNGAAILTTFNDIDMTALVALQHTHGQAFEKHHGIRLRFMPFLVKAATIALEEAPLLNAEVDGTDIVHKHHYDIGVTIDTGREQIVPILRDADRLSITEIEQRIAAFLAAADEGTLTLGDLVGGTFSISDQSAYGALLSVPILNFPQSAILGLHKITETPAVIKGRIEIRPSMYAALSYDHRIIDGKEAINFSARVKQLIEDP